MGSSVKLQLRLAVKVASIIVHADELTGIEGHSFDKEAIRSLLSDEEVQGFLASFPNGLLPVKRKHGMAP